MIYYKDDKIKIRDIQEEDAVNLFLWSIDKELNKNDPRPLPRTSKELAAECIDYCNRFDNEIFNKNSSKRKYMYFIITDMADKAIGFVNFFSIDYLKQQGEMGIKIGDKTCWRKGIAARAVQVVVDYIFENMNINRIYIETTESNKPAISLFQKLQFEYCGQYILGEENNLINEKQNGVNGTSLLGNNIITVNPMVKDYEKWIPF